MSKNIHDSYSPLEDLPVPEALQYFLHLAYNVELPIGDIIKELFIYVNEKKLYDKDDVTIIHPDEKLKRLFNLKENETLTNYTLKKAILSHYLISRITKEVKDLYLL